MTARVSALLVLLATPFSACAVTPAGPSDVSAQTNGTFSGKVYPEGTTRFLFDVTSDSLLQFTLTSVEPSGILLGLEVDVHDETKRSCDPIRHVTTASGSSPQLSAVVAAGAQYCLQVSDSGAIGPSGATFSVTLNSSSAPPPAH